MKRAAQHYILRSKLSEEKNKISGFFSPEIFKKGQGIENISKHSNVLFHLSLVILVKKMVKCLGTDVKFCFCVFLEKII